MSRAHARSDAAGETAHVLAAPGRDRDNRVNPQLGDLLDGPLEAVELDQRQKQREPQRRLHGRQPLEDSEPDFVLRNRLDLGQINRAVVGKLVDLARLGTQDLAQMAGVLAGERLASAADVIRPAPDLIRPTPDVILPAPCLILRPGPDLIHKEATPRHEK